MRTSSTRTLLSVFMLLVGLTQSAAQTNVSGIISANTTWTKAQSPYTLTGNVGVQSGVTLTLEPGVVVRGNYTLQVKGTLVAKGTTGDSVYFQGASNLRPRWPNLSFSGNNPVTATLRVQLFSTNLSASSLVNSSFKDCYLQIGNGEAESPRNTGDLYVDSSSFRNCGVFTQGWYSYRSLNVKNSSLTGSDIVAIAFYSDRINLTNCRLDGGTQVRADNGSQGVSIRASYLKNTDLSPGSSSPNPIELDSCRVIDCTTFQTGSNCCGTSPYGSLFIRRSIVVNTRLNKGEGVLTIDSSVLVFQSPALPSPYIFTNSGSIKNTAIIGNGSGELLSFGPRYSWSGYGNHTDYKNNLFYNGTTAVRFKGLYLTPSGMTESMHIDSNNFVGTQTWHVWNETVKNVPMKDAYFEAATQPEIKSMIYDGDKDFNVGVVDVSQFSLEPNSKAPVAPPAILDKYVSGSGLVIRWAPNAESDIAGYRVHYGTFDGFSFSQQLTVPSGQDSAIVPNVGLNDLVAVTAYDADARGANDQVSGHESWYSFAPPSVPANLTAEPGGRRVKLNWTAAADTGVRYNVYRKPLTEGAYNLVAGGLSGESFTDKGLSADSIYVYFIKAVSSLGAFSEPSNLVTVQPERFTFVENNGDNNNIGGYNTPFKNIQIAIDSAVDGDTVVLKRGIYSERVNFKGKELTLSSSYILDFDTTAIKETVIDASQLARCSSCGDKIIRDSLGAQKAQSLVGLTLRGAESGFVHINIGRLSRLIVEDNRLRPGGTSGLIMGDRLVVDSCIFRNNGLGDQFSSGGLNMLYLGTNSSFTNNQVYNNNVPGHYLAAWGMNMLVKNNTFLQNSYSNAYFNSTGIILSFGASLFSVENNVFANNNNLQAIYANIGYPASSPSALYANTITNNTLFNNTHGDIGLMLYQGSLTIQNNIMYASKGSRPNLSTSSMGSSVSAAVKLVNNVIGAAAGDVFVNTLPNYNLFDSSGSMGNIGGYPGFADTARNDFRLRPSSLALGRGMPGAAVPEKDIMGTLRPSPAGSLPDLGAIESPYGYAAPTLTLVEGGNGQAVVHWSDAPVQGVTKYKLYRATSPIADTATIGVVTDTISVNSRQFTDAGLTNGTRYYYRMKSMDVSGEESGFSNELVTRPNTPPARPDTLVATAGPRAVQLSWPAVTGPGLKYQVLRGTVSHDRKLVADTVAANTFLDTAVAAGTRYYYSVRAVDSFGVVSDHSPVVSALPGRMWWVDASGSNTNLGTSAFPLKQIGYALSKIESGDTIIVKKGAYKEVLRLTKNVVIASEYLLTGNKTLIDETILAQDTSSIQSERVANYTGGFRYEIIGFTIKDVKRTYGNIMELYDCSLRELRFVNNEVYNVLVLGGRSEVRSSVFKANTGQLITSGYGDSTSRTRVIDCKFLNNQAWWYGGQFLVGTSYDLEAYNLLFAGNRAYRLLQASGDSVVLQHLTMVRSGGWGVNINTSKYAEVKNSIIIKNDVDVRFERAPAKIVFRNNLLSQKETLIGSGYDTTGFGSNIIGIDPVFVDTASINYRLSPASMVLGQGDANVAMATDLDGQARPLPANTKPDLGAYENTLAAPKPTTVLQQVVPANKGSVLHWSHFPDTLAVRKFRIYRGATAGATTVVNDSLSRGQTQYTDTNLVNNTTYYYRLRAVDTTGVEMDFSNELSVVPYNKKPVAGFLSDRRLAIGFTRDAAVSITPGSYSDADGVVDSLAWYVNGVRLSNSQSFTGRIPQGTNKVQCVVWDNDGDSDTATAYYHIYAQQVSMKAFPRYGVSAFNRSNIFVIDTVLGTMSKSAVLRLDSLLNPSAGLNTFKVDEGISSEASVSADSIVFIPNGTKLDAFKVNGQPHFQSPLALGGIVNVTPTVDNKRKVIYLGLDNKNFMAISYNAADNGAVKWNYVASAAITSPAVLTRDGKLLFTDATGRLYGFELEQITSSTPAPRWNYYVGGPIRKALALDTSGNVVLATNTALLKLRLKSDGTVEELFKNTTAFSAAPVNTAPVLDADGNIIVGQTNGVVSSVSGTSGSVKWSYNTGTSITSTPSISAYGHIYVLNEKSKLVVLNTDGALQWFFAHSDTAMLAKTTSNTLHVKGTTLISSGFGGMYAFYDVPEGISSDELRMMGTMGQLRVPMWETYQGNIGRSGSGGGSTVTNVVTATPDVVFNDPSWKVYRSAGSRSLLVERIGPATAKARAVVYDMAGRPVESFDVSRRLTERPLPRLISGIYLVVIHEKDKTSVYKVFL